VNYSKKISFKKTLVGIISMIALLFLCQSGKAQSPFNGISVQEVTIPAPLVSVIDNALIGPSAPRCWRVYVCMDDPNWELQAIFGDSFFNWATTTTTTFFQSLPNSGAIANAVNSAFFPFLPESEYDSWFTIGEGASGSDPYSSNTTTLSGVPNPFPVFESGSSFLVNDIVGTSVFGLWLPPNSQGQADVNNQLLIAQITTDGLFSMIMNFQFRRLNPDGTIFVPVETLQVTGIFVDGTPGAEPDICPLVFLSVELLSFEATAGDDHVNLNWATASETSNAYFTIEKSIDQIHYEEVSRMEGGGTTQLSNHYSSIDPNPYEGVSYYRLKQTDTNGEFDYSNTKAVEFHSNADLAIYPNPAHDLVTIDSKEGIIESIRITNTSGKVVSNSYAGSTRQIDLKTLDLSPGVYFVEFTLLGGKIDHQRLVIR
jgi:hypothetical protein